MHKEIVLCSSSEVKFLLLKTILHVLYFMQLYFTRCRGKEYFLIMSGAGAAVKLASSRALGKLYKKNYFESPVPLTSRQFL